MREVAAGVWQIDGMRLPNAVNVYLVDDVLIDASHRHAGKRILRELRGRRVAAHALTHAHADHQGSSHQICMELDIPFWCPDGDAKAAELGIDEMLRLLPDPDSWRVRFLARVWPGPGHPVARRLREGDEVASFRVIDAPGHSPGQAVYWRESDRVLIIGDVLLNLPKLAEPPSWGSTDLSLNRQSAKKLLPLEPSTVLFGHGRPLRNTRAFVKFVEGLPEDSSAPT